MSVLFGIVVFFVSYLLTGLARKYALNKNLLDDPNQRSSHTLPTPRGGGVSIVFLFIIFVLWGYINEEIDGSSFLVLFGSSIIVAGIGILDDHGHVSALWRLFVHFIAAISALYWLGGVPTLHIGMLLWHPGLFGNFFIALLIVWSLNLYNFMDGIDGIAASEGIFVFGSAAFVFWLNGTISGFMLELMVVLVVAMIGFLAWNWPPAKIFMGDACSGFLGFIIVIFALMTTGNGEGSYLSWLILYGVFVVDATVTLLRRVISGEKFYEAHRCHTYQILSRRWNSHQKVTLMVWCINILWLLPLALMSMFYPFFAITFVIIAFAPLVIVTLIVGAGTTS